MSTARVSDLIADAANDTGDPGKTQVLESQWLTFYNRAIRELCERWNVLKVEDDFDLAALDPKYSYPDGMVRMTQILVSDTPADPTTFYTLGEIFEDEFRQATRHAYGTATLPSRYFADQSAFYLCPAPEAAIIDGGKIRYFALPQRVNDSIGTVLELPGWTQDMVVDRMVIEALKSIDMYAEATARYQKWLLEGPRLEDRLEDPSDDRRSALRPPGYMNPYGGMS